MSLRNPITSLPRFRLLVFLLVLALFLGTTFAFLNVVQAQGNPLSVEIIAAYNLVVDSNVSSPSTYAPSVATVIGKVCNNSGGQLTDVQAYIGDGTTPGTYPSKDSSTFDPAHPLYDTGSYSFTHVGGRIGTRDASRYIGTLANGECQVQYWHFEYPQCSNVPDGSGGWKPEDPPCTTSPVWGDSVKPEDDLSLSFDIWADGLNAGSNPVSGNASHTMTMRNEISAMANKIEPNPNGEWFNTNSSTIQPGEMITSNGVLYDLGNINQGFDNDGDYVYDYNAWMQPVGDPNYDPSCFRLIRTTGLITVSRSSGKPDMVIPFQDKLYFSNLPKDNTGAIGNVRYTFLALDGPCSTRLTPYQEVASGADNEKFNADFGGGIPPVGSSSATVDIDKNGNTTVAEGANISYNIPFENTGSEDAGLPLNNAPLVISDSVPAGLTYQGSSTTYSGAGITTLYSTDGGITWTSTEPAPGTQDVLVQWWLDDALAAGASGTVSLVAQVPGGYINGGGDAAVENCAEGSFGAGAPFEEACTTTLVEGTNTIGDFVWRDEDNDRVQDGGSETGIDQITVSLYWDADGDGELDSDDALIQTTETSSGGAYSFTNLPDGDYIVEVDGDDTDLPNGYRVTGSTTYATTLSNGNDLDADFGFGPSLAVDKAMVDGEGYEGQEVTYNITVRNLRPGGGTESGGMCTYTVWGSEQDAGHSETQANKQWQNEANAFGAPDGSYATTQLANADDTIALTGFSSVPQNGTITNVNLVLYADDVVALQGGETLETTIYFNDAASSPTVQKTDTDFDGVPGAPDIFVTNVTGNNTAGWDWSDFSSNYIDVQIIGSKSGGANGEMGLDAVGFQVTTDEPCVTGGADDTIDTIPLEDTYDTTYLQFVSALPAQTSHDSGAGTLTWDNVGPLGPGESRVVNVTFLVQDLGGATRTVNNTASVTGATFANGDSTNDDSANESGTLLETGSIAGVVWSDLNSNGWQGTTGYESGTDAFIGNVTAALHECVGLPASPNTNNTCVQNGGAWQAIASQSTDAGGAYAFDALPEGYYYVDIDPNTLPGTPTQTGDPDDTPGTCGTCDNRWQDDVALKNLSKVDPAGTLDYTDINFGYASVPITIYGTVWQDHDGDASQDAGDNGISGATVYLCTSTPCDNSNDVASTTTGTDGTYSFESGLSDGVTYYVGVDNTTAPLGAMWSNTVDPDGSSGNNTMDTGVTVSSGSVYGSYDFGYTQSGTTQVAGTLYTDWDGDGVQETGEAGIGNVTVYLYEDSDGDGSIDAGTDALVASTTTGGDGSYSFSNLPAGDYIVVIDEDDSDLPNSYSQTGDPDEAGTCSTCDADGSADTSSGATGIDFGYRPAGTGSIGDFVWEDDDADGLQDAGESGLDAIGLTLYYDSDGSGDFDVGSDALVATTETDADGAYTFAQLPAGTYFVDVDAGDPDLPSDGYGQRYILSTNGDPHTVTLPAATAYTDADFGFTAAGTIGDFIWQDNDRDGTQDTNEPGIAGVDVLLYVWNDTDSDGVLDSGEIGSLIDQTTTDADGLYEFTGLAAGDYVLQVDSSNFDSGSALENYSLTYDPNGYSNNAGKPYPPCDTSDGDYVDCDHKTGVGLALGQIDRSSDFGYSPLGVLGDTVWLNSDVDGTRDSGESGIANVDVSLYLDDGNNAFDSNDTLQQTTSTDLDGYYSFGDLSDGTYHVVVDTADTDFPSGLVQNYDPDGTADDTASTIVVSNGSVTSIDSNSCSTNCDLDIDFGYDYNGSNSISGHVFFDDGGTGDGEGDMYDSGADSPYEGITVYLWDSNGNLVDTTTTAAGDGTYSFGGLPASTDFTVSVDTQAPQLKAQSLTATPGSPGNAYNTVTTSASNQDFGFNASMDFGDLPDSYNTLLASEGAYHTISSLYLGTSPDAESNGLPNSTAEGDNNDGTDDEDGVNRDMNDNWTSGATVDLNIDVTGTGGYLVGWFDWNGDGDFGDTSEIKQFGTVSSGASTISLQVPGSSVYTVGTTVNARFRLYDGQPTFVSPTGGATNGEVEDYQWEFGPTSVTLTSARTTTQDAGTGLPLALAAGLMAAAGLIVLRSRRRR